MERMVAAAMRGTNGVGPEASETEEAERWLAHSLTLIWFSLLVGWSGGLRGQAVVIDEMSNCTELMLLGARQRNHEESGRSGPSPWRRP